VQRRDAMQPIDDLDSCGRVDDHRAVFRMVCHLRGTRLAKHCQEYCTQEDEKFFIAELRHQEIQIAPIDIRFGVQD
jgi:hypothetical protein